MDTPTIYLVGAIRDNRDDDIEWREQVIADLRDFANIINPVGGKTYNPATREWKLCGIPSTARTILKHDFFAVDHADIVLANMTALSEGYPNIGSLIELGRASGTGALIYTIIDEGYKGHENSKMFGLHPFLEGIASANFTSVGDATRFLQRYLQSLTGYEPNFDGIVGIAKETNG